MKATKLQSRMLLDELLRIARTDEGKLLDVKSLERFSEILEIDIQQISFENRDKIQELIVEELELRLRVLESIDELLVSGIMQPYFFPKVQELGTEALLSYRKLQILIQNNRACFKLLDDIEYDLDSLSKSLDDKQEENRWIS